MKSISKETYTQRLDRLRIPDFYWIPYWEHRWVRDFDLISCFFGELRWGFIAIRYRPARVMHQFGYVQSIPGPPANSWVSFDEIDDRWMHYSHHLAPVGEICVMPGQCAADYIDWFFIILHPFMTTTQTSDPSRDAPATQPKHIP